MGDAFKGPLAMLSGAHVILYSPDADADRAFLRDILALPYVDVGRNWLIFALPPSEIAVHPAEGESKHDLYFKCDNVQTFVEHMRASGFACSQINEQRWGWLTEVTLPSGAKLGIYQPKHERPKGGD
jgi:hypothetical protein